MRVRRSVAPHGGHAVWCAMHSGAGGGVGRVGVWVWWLRVWLRLMILQLLRVVVRLLVMV